MAVAEFDSALAIASHEAASRQIATALQRDDLPDELREGGRALLPNRNVRRCGHVALA